MEWMLDMAPFRLEGHCYYLAPFCLWTQRLVMMRPWNLSMAA